ncbi:MAG: hypothetical protein IJD59_10680, partial [Clostridia bacterium]|nr:hypothetical protein [Clostridia bacterium]
PAARWFASFWCFFFQTKKKHVVSPFQREFLLTFVEKFSHKQSFTVPTQKMPCGSLELIK